jgi:hypothetical protein
MTSPEAAFAEVTAERRVAAVPFSHLSVELGHLYMEDFLAGRESLTRQFEQVRPWATAAGEAAAKRARISTCFLVDDYFTRFSTPGEVIADLLAAAAEAGLVIDYLARESGCAVAGKVPLAELVESRIVPDPAPGTNGSRPHVHESGWLCNGQRSAATTVDQAMAGSDLVWRPPEQNGARRHSIFADVELWDDVGGRRTWSCPFLASVWQLLRLGLLRNDGQRVAEPVLWEGAYPAEWDDLPAIVKLNPQAQPFTAYQTFSVLGTRFLPIEHAVRTILSQVSIDPEVLRQAAQRSGEEKLRIPTEVVDRIAYAFLGEL